MEHDRLCRTYWAPDAGRYSCSCDFIAEVRSYERDRVARRLLDAWDTYVPMAVVGAGYGPWLDRMLAAAHGHTEGCIWHRCPDECDCDVDGRGDGETSGASPSG